MQQPFQLKTGLFSGHGESSRLSDTFVAAWRERYPDAEVVTRDFATDPVPHPDSEGFQAFLTKPEDRTLDQQARAAYSDELIEELTAADALVIGCRCTISASRRC